MKVSWPEPLAALREDIVGAARDAFGDPSLRALTAEPAPGGHSGFTYFLGFRGETGEQAAVVRVPPPRARPVGPADVLRHGRIMAALGRAGLPAPAVLAMVPGERTAGGRPFLLLQMVESDPLQVTVAGRSPRQLLEAALGVLAGIAGLPLEATGLGGEPVEVPLAQVDRWEPLMRRAPAELTRGWERLAGSLRARPPEPPRAALVHGDYQFGNLLFRGGRVVAVLDWEIAALAAPQIDVACLAVAAIRRRFPSDPYLAGGPSLDLDEVLEAAGGPSPLLRWYVAAGCYKYSAILGYNLDLHRRGRRIDPLYERMPETVSGLIEAGLEIAGTP